MSITWQGVFPAVTTKYTANGELDIDMFIKGIQAQQAAGVHGIVLGGTLGEASTLTPAEKETLVKTTLQTVEEKIPVILNIAEGSTAVAVELARSAEEWGANGLM